MAIAIYSCQQDKAALLPFFQAAAEQDNERFPVLAEVDPITGAEVDFALVDPPPTPSTLEKLPGSKR